MIVILVLIINFIIDSFKESIYYTSVQSPIGDTGLVAELVKRTFFEVRWIIAVDCGTDKDLLYGFKVLFVDLIDSVELIPGILTKHLFHLPILLVVLVCITQDLRSVFLPVFEHRNCFLENVIKIIDFELLRKEWDSFFSVCNDTPSVVELEGCVIFDLIIQHLDEFAVLHGGCHRFILWSSYDEVLLARFDKEWQDPRVCQLMSHLVKVNQARILITQMVCDESSSVCQPIFDEIGLQSYLMIDHPFSYYNLPLGGQMIQFSEIPDPLRVRQCD